MIFLQEMGSHPGHTRGSGSRHWIWLEILDHDFASIDEAN